MSKQRPNLTGDVTQDSFFRSFGKRKSILAGFTPGSFRRRLSLKLKSKQNMERAIPLASDLWYMWDVFTDEDVYPEDQDQRDNLEQRLGASVVKTVIGVGPEHKKRLFPAAYQYVPDDKVPLDEPPFEMRGEKLAVSLNMLAGDIAAARYLTLVGDESNVEASDKIESDDLIPPTPKAPGSEEIKLLNDFYFKEDESVDLTIYDDDRAPFHLIKKKVVGDEKFPVPGEMVALAVRAYPNHAWFNQDTNPFIFSANWFETDWYSSGVVKAVNKVGANSADRTYDVEIKGKLETDVKANDYQQYVVDDRVALLKTDSSAGLFTEKDLVDYNTNWVIVPITFYKGE